MCKKCEGKMRNCAMGTGTECGHTVSSRGLKWCVNCAKARKVCQACGEPLPAAKKK